MAKRNSSKSKSYIQLVEFFKDAYERGIIESYKVPEIDLKTCGRFKVYKPTIDNITFDSGMEAKYYVYLLEKIQAGIVDSFSRQQEFQLQPSFKVGDKRVAAIKYIADFVITYTNGNVIVVDVKGRETPDFKIKKKMFEYKFRMPLYCVQFYQDQWLRLDDIKKLKRHKK